MSTLSILLPGAVFVGFVYVSFHRIRRRAPPKAPETAASAAPIPENATIAGVPLRIVLSDRSGPGAVLRDRLMTGPPPSA